MGFEQRIKQPSPQPFSSPLFFSLSPKSHYPTTQRPRPPPAVRLHPVPLDFEDSSMAQAIGGANVQTALWAVRCRARSTPKGRGKTVKVVPQKEKGQQKNGGFGDKEQRKEPLWQCVKGCGACCKLAKDPSFATPEEIFENPSDIELYKSLIGPDGWCIHYDKSTRTCSIYDDRPYFCHVDPDVFQNLYGINKRRFNKEACSCCQDTIKAIYGANSEELHKFNKAIRS